MTYTEKRQMEELPAVQPKYKDTVFRMLFRGKAELLSLYNAVNGTHFDNVDDLEITTLENAVYMNMKNDVSFVFAFELSLYEHQSTVNPNIPLRDLFYVAKQLQKMVPDMRLYGSKPVQIPVPRFVVFYNGNTKMPEKTKYCLSDLFEKPVEHPELELSVMVYNINPGMNEELLEACRLLKEYMLFTTKIRENRKTMPLEEAVDKAVADCIREGILAEFLEKQRVELQYGVQGIVEKRKADFDKSYRTCITIGTALCIISVIPLFVGAALEFSDLLLVYCVAILLVLIACGVLLFVWSCTIQESFDKLKEFLEKIN